MDYINKWLTVHKPVGAKDLYIRCDLGSELGRNAAFKSLVAKHGYKLEPTAPGSSFQNSPAERPNETIGDALRTMLHGSNVDMKLWDHVFCHFITTSNHVLHGTDEKTPHHQVTGQRGDLSRLRTFGCRVWVRLPGRRSHKLDPHVNKGIFLGYTATMRNIYYLDCDTDRIKTTQHCRFDEGMNDLPSLPPNARRLR